MAMQQSPPRVLVDGRRCVALVLRGCGCGRERNGASLFTDWLQRNAAASSRLEYRGCVPPCTLLLYGSQSALEGVRSAWAQRRLRPPRGYAIDGLGDVVGTLSMRATPLEDDSPCRTRGGLVRERTRIRGRADGDYGRRCPPFGVFASPDDSGSPPMPRQELTKEKIQNRDELPVFLQPRPQTSFPDPRMSRITECRPPLQTIGDKGSSPSKESTKFERGLKEGNSDKRLSHKTSDKRQSVLAKILKRVNLLTDRSTTKHALFSAQFPPINTRACCHSIGKGPAIKLLESTGSKTSREEIPSFGFSEDHPRHVSLNTGHKNLQGSKADGSNARRNPSLLAAGRALADSHRYPHHGTFPKRRHKYRPSSQNSPKIQRNLLNNCNRQSLTSRSSSGDKACRSSSNDTTFTPPDTRPNNWNSPKESDLLQASEDQGILHSSRASLSHEASKLAKNNLKTNIDSIPDAFEGQKIHAPKKDEHLPQTGAGQTSSSEKSVSCNCSTDPSKPEIPIRPLPLKGIVDIPAPQSSKVTPNEILVDNSVRVEVPLKRTSKTNDVLSTTIVTEETTVMKENGNSKVVTVTSITTSLSQGGLKTLDDADCFPESAAYSDQ